jgi:hypothetical protein
VRGQEEGVKDRPCAVILVTQDEDGEQLVTVLPVTHSPPLASEAELFIEIPSVTKRRLGLDDAQSWVVLSEANRFIWPGPDLRPVHIGEVSTVVFGLLPNAFYEKVRKAFLSVLKSGRTKTVSRTQ